MKNGLRGLLTLPALALSLAVAVPAAGAVTVTTARLAPPAQLNDDGSVNVPVEFTCPDDRRAGINVALEQQKAQDYTEGSGWVSVDCTGTRQVVDIVVPPRYGPFDNGRVLAKMYFYSHTIYPAPWASDQVQEAGMIRIAN